MRAQRTKLGTVWVAPEEALFDLLRTQLDEVWCSRGASVALSGGSTPRRFYRWAAAAGLPVEFAHDVDWTVSDERCVPLSDSESNFGTAERMLLDPLAVPAARRHPWPVGLPPAEAAARFEVVWAQRASARTGVCADVCLAGMGADGHILSLFPGSPLLTSEQSRWFAQVDVPDKGWRLTFTPAALEACARIVLLATGSEKAAPLHRALHGPDDPVATPVQLLARHRERVMLLLDPAAAAGLS